MAASISGLFQGGMKTFGGNPGLIPHSVSAKIFLQPWKVILEWILSLSAQKWTRPYQEGLVFSLQLFYYTVSCLTSVLTQQSTEEGGEVKEFFYKESSQSSWLVSSFHWFAFLKYLEINSSSLQGKEALKSFVSNLPSSVWTLQLNGQ